MFAIRLLLLLIQVFHFLTVNAALSPLRLERAAITLTESTNQAINDSLANLDNDVSLIFSDLGGRIPANELRHTLSFANNDVQAHLPRYADRPISKSHFETNISFPRTGDNVYLWVYAYGSGLSWRQLSEALMKLQAYVLGLGPGHPVVHCQELEFYVRLTTGMETARGAIEFTPGTKAVAKRALDTPALQLVQANYSSQNNADVALTFNIAKNLDLQASNIGIPIPEDVILYAIDRAFTDVVLKHDDIDTKIPKNLYPYSFNSTSGKWPKSFITEIVFNPSNSKRGITWSLLCIIYYGLRDYMRASKNFNVLEFEVTDARLGSIGNGKVQYRSAHGTASS